MSKSITQCLSGIRRADIESTEHLWKQYYASLVQVARRHFRDYPRGAYDEEDAAESALISFFSAATKNRYSNLSDREGLWKLLTTIVIRKVNRRVRRRSMIEYRPETHGESPESDSGCETVDVEELVSNLFSLLQNDGLRQTAALRMHGYSNKESSEILCCSVKSIERRMRLVRAIWEREVAK